jgi:signal transduction histidine kinase
MCTGAVPTSNSPACRIVGTRPRPDNRCMRTSDDDSRSGGAWHLLASTLLLPVSPRTWIAFAFLILSFAIGLAWFIVLVTLISTGAGLAITLVGLPILVFTAVLWTFGARLERWRVRLMLGVRIASPYRPLPDGPWTRRLRAFFTDGAVWRDLIYLFLLFPIGIAEFVIAVTTVATTGAFVTLPIYYWALPEGSRTIVDFDGHGPIIDTLPEALLGAAAALPVLLLALWLIRLMATGHGLLAQALLGPSRAELESRVDVLSTSRSRVLDSAAQERRRLERDLHDGVQQHLTALAMDLGMAREKLESNPEAGRELVARAHEEAKSTLAELRQLVRGISPAILSDRGLDAAVSALAARCPVPVIVDVDLSRRPPDIVEMTAYFVVAESLTNVARHSGASKARVTVWESDHRIVVEVWDNGRGDADPLRGTGLDGLSDRVAGIDGRLRIDSPPGGPTSIRAELPCA